MTSISAKRNAMKEMGAIAIGAKCHILIKE
jgi:hypothetical protein